MTDWLAFCRGAVGDIEEVLQLRPAPPPAEPEPVLRASEGGDDTTAIDAAGEERRRAAARGARHRSHAGLGGAGRAVVRPRRRAETVVVDPINSYVNAKRGIPFFSLSLAVADGPTMDDVFFGYV